MPHSLPTLPPHPAGLPWPTADWPTGEPASDVDRDALAAAADAVFDLPGDHGHSTALLAVHRGRIVLERYADGVGPGDTQPSWSMAKSITQALLGILVRDGRIDVDAPLWTQAPVPEWAADGDPRQAITARQLLAMRSGLQFVEHYVPGEPSDVIQMLWSEDDVAAYAAAKPLAHPPGKVFSYSSGTTNILARAIGAIVGGGAEGMQAFMNDALFAPIGITSAEPKFDGPGTFKGSSFCFCTPRDFARFGYLYLRDGTWDGQRLLPEGWVDAARTPTFTADGSEGPHGHYGEHWWLLDGQRTFYASGFEGQRIVVDPDRDLLIVRNGHTPEPAGPAVAERVYALRGAFPAG